MARICLSGDLDFNKKKKLMAFVSSCIVSTSPEEIEAAIEIIGVLSQNNYVIYFFIFISN